MRIIILTSVLFLFSMFQACSEKQSEDPVIGTWEGTLHFPGFDSRLVFIIEENPDGELIATLRKPDENENVIPVDQINYDGSLIELHVSSFKCMFSGRLHARDSLIRGEWRHGIHLQPVRLKKVETVYQPDRPQTPHPPFPYNERRITYTNPAEGNRLSGTLTWPDSGSVFPSIILIAGGGRHDRDYTIARHKPFLVMADYFTRSGFAVLRFDERGVGGSTGDREKATILNMAGDVLAGLIYLKENPFFTAESLGLLGHSEGGMIATLAAGKSTDVSFLVLMATPGLPGQEYHLQFEEVTARAVGLKEKQIKRRIALQKKVLGIIAEAQSREQAEDQLYRVLGDLSPPLPEDRIAVSVARFLSPWFRFNISYDPQEELSRVSCPLLALFAEKDLHVPPAGNLEALERAIRNTSAAKSKAVVLPGLNHFFQTVADDTPFQYGKTEETIAPSVLAYIADWILQQALI